MAQQAQGIAQVAHSQPLRLLHGSMQPLEAIALHPARRPAHLPGDEVEGSPDADAYRDLEAVAVHREPLFLLGIAESHQKNVGPRVFDAAQNLFVIHGFEGLRLRRITAYNAQVRIPLSQPLGGGRRAAFAAAEQEDAVATPCRNVRQPLDEVDTADPLLERRSDHARYPDDRHAVGDHHVAGAEDFPQFLLLHGVLEKVDVGRRYLMKATLADMLFDCRNSLVHRDIVKRYSKDSDSVTGKMKHLELPCRFRNLIPQRSGASRDIAWLPATSRFFASISGRVDRS